MTRKCYLMPQFTGDSWLPMKAFFCAAECREESEPDFEEIGDYDAITDFGFTSVRSRLEFPLARLIHTGLSSSVRRAVVTAAQRDRAWPVMVVTPRLC